ncbi:hypothetical protein Tco_0646191 [Tanacetum coccineum]
MVWHHRTNPRFTVVGAIGLAAAGPLNVVARRAIDEIDEFSGETEAPKYMKMEAMDDQDEYFDSLMCLRDTRRMGYEKVVGLNERIVELRRISAPWKGIWKS